jgi:hypothetical protein
MRRARTLVAAALLASAAQQPLRAEEPATATPAPTLPTPYSAEQIRDAWQPGLVVEMRTTAEEGVSGERLTVVTATSETGTIRQEALDASGALREPAGEFTSTWTELRDHALFEAATATRGRAECHSGLGPLPGWRYVVSQPDGRTLSMCFADAAPGPPVEYERLEGGEAISRTEHTRYERPSSGAKP